MLLYALAVGNYLNGQSPKGGAFGFRIENLKSLEEVKANDKRTNLFMYVITKAETDTGKELLNPAGKSYIYVE